MALLRASACVFGALLFGCAAWSKFGNRDVFKGVLGAYRILPSVLVEPMAILLPAVESGVAVLLLIPDTQSAGASVAAALALCFAAAIGINVARGRLMIDCGCGGRDGRQNLSLGLVLGNLALAVLFASCARIPPAVSEPILLFSAAAAGTSLYLLHAAYRTLAVESKRPLRRISPALRRLAWARLPGGAK